MTIIEALKTGLPFKLPEHAGWLVSDDIPDHHGAVVRFQGREYAKQLLTEELLSNNWIVKREPITFECEKGELKANAYGDLFILGKSINLLMVACKRTRVTIEVIDE